MRAHMTRNSLSKKGYRFVKMHKNNLVNWPALRPRGPFLFRSAGKGNKRGRFARHFGSGKIETRSNPFSGPSQTRRFTSSQTHGKVRFCPTVKNSLTSHAVRFCGCCLGLPSAVTLTKAGCENCVMVKLTGCAATFCVPKIRLHFRSGRCKFTTPKIAIWRPRQHCAKLGAWLVRGFPRAAGKRKGFLSEPP